MRADTFKLRYDLRKRYRKASKYTGPRLHGVLLKAGLRYTELCLRLLQTVVEVSHV